MRIHELTLRNYRVYAEEPPFEFKDRFTVVAGINGRGKTALLEGLALLCSQFLPHVSAVRSGGYRTITPAEVHIGTTFAELSMKVNCAGIPIEYRLTYDKDRRKKETTKLPTAVKREVRKAYGDPARADDAAPLAVYYTTDRAGYRLPNKLLTEVPRGQAAAYSGALRNRIVNFRDFMSRYRSAITVERTERRNNPNYIGDRAVTAISHALTTFLGGFENLRVQEEPLRLLVDKDGETLDLSQLSDGERSFLAMICDLGRRLALANPRLSNPLHGPGVVLIDELELHLHPKWQRQIIHNMTTTFPHCQFIATTHSPQVVASVEPDQVHLLASVGIIHPDRSLGMDSNWILRHLMDAEDRPEQAMAAIQSVESLIGEGIFEEARTMISEAKKKGLDLPEWSVLEARIARLEILAE